MTGAAILPGRLLTPALLGGPAATTVGPDGPPGPAADAPFDLPDLGACDHQRVLLVLLFDNSPSVVDDHDPVGRRFEEATIALSRYRRRCGCLRELVAVRTFDRQTSSDVGPTYLDGAGWPQIAAALSTPPEVGEGWSRLRPALRDVERMAASYPGHRAALVVFSDFQLLDLFPDRVLDRLGRFPGRVHAVVLGADAPARLLSSVVAVSRITSDSQPGDVARAVVSVLADVSETEPSR